MNIKSSTRLPDLGRNFCAPPLIALNASKIIMGRKAPLSMFSQLIGRYPCLLTTSENGKHF